ncbi:MAG: hypothetical protein QGG40_09060 [Myxococcota bacterium]|jgi:hypothetical protein|nr:hypothetical protein [Myxococcota bacterium]
MRAFLLSLLVGFGIAAIGTGSAWAQDTVAGELAQSSTTTPKEKLEFASAALDEMRSAVKSSEKMLTNAQREDDVEMSQCLRNKMASMRALAEVSEGARGAMQEALASSNMERAEHEFRKVAVAVSKVRQFMAEAEACLGEGAARPGTTEVEVTVEGITDVEDDTVGSDAEVGVVGVDPPQTSPFE